jgi:hypothetical protein
MGVRIDHALACEKADQQHPRIINMIFILFQAVWCIIYINAAKVIIKKLTMRLNITIRQMP